mmetsp:Transcript_30164/g.56069  ORF Transcript_30164/g.56069 Transcript_30164/m.56069 type:complete len:357 (+) Transcript_30164:2767-3837(+)
MPRSSSVMAIDSPVTGAGGPLDIASSTPLSGLTSFFALLVSTFSVTEACLSARSSTAAITSLEDRFETEPSGGDGSFTGEDAMRFFSESFFSFGPASSVGMTLSGVLVFRLLSSDLMLSVLSLATLRDDEALFLSSIAAVTDLVGLDEDALLSLLLAIELLSGPALLPFLTSSSRATAAETLCSFFSLMTLPDPLSSVFLSGTPFLLLGGGVGAVDEVVEGASGAAEVEGEENCLLAVAAAFLVGVFRSLVSTIDGREDSEDDAAEEGGLSLLLFVVDIEAELGVAFLSFTADLLSFSFTSSFEEDVFFLKAFCSSPTLPVLASEWDRFRLVWEYSTLSRFRDPGAVVVLFFFGAG